MTNNRVHAHLSLSQSGECILRSYEVKEKMTSVYKYRHEYEPVGLTLITVFRDAVYGVMPPLGGGLW